MIVILLVLAVAFGAVIAYGTQPFWAQYPHGIELILMSRRMQWPLVAFCLLACAGVIVVVVAGRRRAWWLIGLLPVVALFAHHFAIDPTRAMQITSEAQLLSADQAKFLDGNDDVVGVVFQGEAYAFPYRCLYASPVAVAADQNVRLMMIWSAFANRAVACPIDRSVKPDEMEIVSVPANALLLYNARLGQFINGVTGLTMDGQRPSGFGSPVATEKLPWKIWRSLHPATVVMGMPPGNYGQLPNGPVEPYYPMPGGKMASSRRVALIEATRPVAIDEGAIVDLPLNVTAGDDPLLVFRDASGASRAFYRVANGDLTPRFVAAPAKHGAGVFMVDCDSQSTWAVDGRVVAGPLKGEKLLPAMVEDDVYLDVVKFWMPQLTLIAPQMDDLGVAAPPPPAPVLRRHRGRRSLSAAF